ncbi:DUF1433 domain-containing protein [Virgibacillus senegalensis]|uniref:DUF1433 domain-containing protein n=1 Tax=Virgibacillus senegalensis TaxID=1499679 RepID=UPI00069D68AF|nr:DUF1433 domain-containing protein [Virgibacillus senegalensis]
MREITFIILLILLTLAGCNVNTNTFDEQTIIQAKETAESYLRNNFESIHTIMFSEDYSNPMGGLMIRGTVNGKAGFSASVDPKEFTVNSLGEKEGFPKVKDECKEKVCDY